MPTILSRGLLGIIVFLFSSCAQTVKDTPAPFTTETPNPDGYSFPHPDNVASPAVHGLWVVQSGNTLCLNCHKTDAKPSLPGPRCDSCHAIYPHASGWVAKEAHGKYVIDHGQTACQSACHGTDLSGGYASVSCTKCHTTYPHVEGWSTALLHGASALGDKKNVCKLCHGDTFTGGQSAVACSDCHAPYPHATGWLAGRDSIHGPIVTVEGSKPCEACHGANNSGSIFSTFCNDCHKQHLSSPITCKQCHEAGKGLTDSRPQDGIHPATQDCADCHHYATGDFEILKGETITFDASPHHANTDGIFSGHSSVGCARCHNLYGYRDYTGADGTAADIINSTVSFTAPAPLDCTACHNSKTSEYLNSGVDIRMTSGNTIHVGREGFCVRCHQARTGEGSLKVAGAIASQAEDAVLSGTYTYAQWPGNSSAGGTVSASTNRNKQIVTHYLPAANIFYGNDGGVGYQYAGKTYVGKNTLMPGYGTCITCHNPHTSKAQPAKCAPCHTGVTTTTDFQNIRKTMSDYDGDGNTTEGTYAELEGVKTKLYQAIQNYATNVVGTGILYVPGTGSTNNWNKSTGGLYDASPGKWTPRLLKAAFNYDLVYRDANAFVHNSKYAMELLYDAIEDLNAGMDATNHAANKVDMTGMVRP